MLVDFDFDRCVDKPFRHFLYKFRRDFAQLYDIVPPAVDYDSFLRHDAQ